MFIYNFLKAFNIECLALQTSHYGTLWIDPFGLQTYNLSITLPYITPPPPHIHTSRTDPRPDLQVKSFSAMAA